MKKKHATIKHNIFVNLGRRFNTDEFYNIPATVYITHCLTIRSLLAFKIEGKSITYNNMIIVL